MQFKTITMSLVDHLRLQIITGALKPQQKLKEQELAESLRISRHPLREAFRLLESEHLIISTPRKGASVSDISIEDLKRLYGAREMLECYAIEVLKASNIRDIPEVAAAMLAASSLRRPSIDDVQQVLAFIEAAAEFHKRLIEATNNYWIIHFYNSISPHLARYLYLYFYIPGIKEKSEKEHEEILRFINEGSFDRAKENMKIHIRKSHDRLKARVLEFREDFPVTKT
jgi:DNA-binding GntR family transcriptional regulator